jgi:hypothetical protein
MDRKKMFTYTDKMFGNVEGEETILGVNGFPTLMKM